MGYPSPFPEHPKDGPKRQIEREFGVPIPGEILTPDKWAQTALKELPQQGPISFPTVFGRIAPVIVDIGCGNGRYLLGSAYTRAHYDHIGFDVLPMVIRYATRRGNQRGFSNLRFGVADGLKVVRQLLAPASVDEIHVYHPQPYHDVREAGRRLLTPSFLSSVHDCLKPGGELYLQTDHPGYWKAMRESASHFFDFHERIGRWPDSPRGRTRREILSMKRGLPIFRGMGTRRDNLDSATKERLVRELPLPLFGIHAESMRLDREEATLRE